MRFVKNLVLASLIPAILSGCSRMVQRDGAPDGIVIDTASRLGAVDPLLYGHFLEPIYRSVVGGLEGHLLGAPGFEEQDITELPDVRSAVGFWGVGPEGLTGDWVHWLRISSRAEFEPLFEGDFTLRFRVRKLNPGWHGMQVDLCDDAGRVAVMHVGNRPDGLPSVEVRREGNLVGDPASISGYTLDHGVWKEVEVARRGRALTMRVDGVDHLSATLEGVGPVRIALGTMRTRCTFQDIVVTRGDGSTWSPMLEATENQVSAPWKVSATAPGAVWRLDHGNPRNGERALSLQVPDGASVTISQENLGLAGRAFDGQLSIQGVAWGVEVGLSSGALGSVEEVFSGLAGDWVDRSFRLELPEAPLERGTFHVRIDGPADVLLDQVLLRHAGGRMHPTLAAPARELRPTFMRWPGGCYAEHYRWMDGIGPLVERRPKPNNMWEGIDPNFLGTDEFLQLCEEWNSVPIIVLNIGVHQPDAHQDEYLAEALAWLEYCNGDATTPMGAIRAANGRGEPYNVKYWEIGNETWGAGADRYVAMIERFSKALRAADPNVVLLACGSGGYDQEWNRHIVGAAAEHFDLLSVHHYAERSEGDPLHDARVKYPAFLDDAMEIIRESANPSIKLAVTEWNEMSTTMMTGLYAGLILNEMERRGNDVVMACPALWLRHVDAPYWDNALINHDGLDYYTAPNYQVMKLWRDNLVTTAVEVRGAEKLSLLAGLDESGDVVLRVVNASGESVDSGGIVIDGVTRRPTMAWRVKGDSLDDRNSMDNRNNIAIRAVSPEEAHVFPSYSATVLRFAK